MNLCLYVHDNPPIKEWNEVITELHYSTCKLHSFLIYFWGKKYDKIKFSNTKDIILRTELVIYCCVSNSLKVCFIKTDTLYLVVSYIKCIRSIETDFRSLLFCWNFEVTKRSWVWHVRYFSQNFEIQMKYGSERRAQHF